MANQNFRVKNGLEVGTSVTISAEVVTATTFVGALTGTATTATGLSGTPNITVGVATASTFVGALTGTATTATGLSGTPNITVGTVTAASGTFTGNVSIAGTLTYEDVTNIDSVGLITARTGIQVLAGGIDAVGVITATSFSGSGANLTGIAATTNVRTNSLVVSGISTLGNTVVGGGTTQLIVTGDARITGILTIGTSSITLDGSNNQVNVGTGVTLHHTNGVQVGGNNLHSTGLTVNSLNVSGIVTATSLVGTAATTFYTSEWTLGADGNHNYYTFTGPGFIGAENDPTLYLMRGGRYKFTNTMNAHPFRIQSTPNGSAGTEYNDGITNNNVQNETLTWNVQFDTPSLLYYQCTVHGSMGGKIYIIDAGIGPDISINTTGTITASSFSGNTTTATTLQTARNINGISFNGSAEIVVNPSSGAYSNGYGARTVSTNNPSGGSDGDVWYKY